VSARVGGALALAALVALPPLMSKYHLEILISVLFWAYLGIAWNMLGGYAGQFSFGHAAFFGIGAYTSTLLLLRAGLTPWIGMALGGVLAAVFGLFEGYLSFRYGLKGPYFSLVTLAFAEMLRVIAVNTKAAGSSLGLVVPTSPSAPGLFIFSGKLPYYYIILAMGALALALTWKIGRSRLGFSLAAVRENRVEGILEKSDSVRIPTSATVGASKSQAAFSTTSLPPKQAPGAALPRPRRLGPNPRASHADPTLTLSSAGHKPDTSHPGATPQAAGRNLAPAVAILFTCPRPGT